MGTRLRALFAALVLMTPLMIPTVASAELSVSVTIGPPALPVYSQPPCPGDGYLWTPGYWAWDDDDDDYYWVPGTWVLAPSPGLLWTPGYWGWNDGFFFWHAGYWGPFVGFYGGINYGFGYHGYGYDGGRWRGNNFQYNTTVNNVNVTNVHNTYNETVINNYGNNSRVSYNGGDGTRAHADEQENRAWRERHDEATSQQFDHEREAREHREQHAAFNHGRPEISATAEPANFREHGGGRWQDRSGERGHQPQPQDWPSRGRAEQRYNGEDRGTSRHEYGPSADSPQRQREWTPSESREERPRYERPSRAESDPRRREQPQGREDPRWQNRGPEGQVERPQYPRGGQYNDRESPNRRVYEQAPQRQGQGQPPAQQQREQQAQPRPNGEHRQRHEESPN
jgi:hypothetical protein